MVHLPENLRAFLQRQRVAHLATSDAQGAPHVVPICFVLLEDAVYSVIDEKPKTTTRLKRLRNIEANPRSALVADEYDEDWSRLAWVMLRGSAAVLSPGPEQRRALAALRDKYPQYRQMDLDDRPLIRLTIERPSSWGLE